MQQLITFPGRLRLGVIISYDEDNASVEVLLNQTTALTKEVITAQLPISGFSNNGIFIGSYPEPGTSVVVQQSEGRSWYILSIIIKDPSTIISDPNTLSTFKSNKLPTLSSGQIIIQSNPNNQITIDKKEGIQIGNATYHAQSDTSRSVHSINFKQKLSFTEASLEVSGIIKRDLKPNINLAASFRKMAHEFDDSLKIISMDPTVSPNISNVIGSIRNPPLVEKREVIYEFASSFKPSSIDNELSSYKTNIDISEPNIINRRESRADALSLSLVEPNYLIETIKGTVVDIYGNILDINRSILPIGQTDNLSINKIKDTANNNTNNVFLNIKELERRSIAFHFELNARKGLNTVPDVSSQDNYARDRSRLFLDIDKEGLFKLNIPASSETGNVPLLTRYENYSTVFPNPDTNNPNDLVSNSDKQDILIEPFGFDGGVIKVNDNSGLDGYASPKDRFDSSKHIGVGMAYHNVKNICEAFQNEAFAPIEYIPTTTISALPLIKNIVNPIINISGDNANAGGRSGSINLDGSIELNIGANTVDRQSMWLDTAGGILGNIGRDANNVSMGLSLDGDMLIQIGGSTVDTDSRFDKLNNSHRAGALDIRVLNTNTQEVTVFRIDKNGVTVSTPGRLVMYSNQDILLRSAATINIEAEGLFLNRRPVAKVGGSI